MDSWTPPRSERTRNGAWVRVWLFGLVLVLVGGCTPDREKAERFRNPLEVGVDRMEGVDWWFYSQGKVKAHAVAGRAAWHRNQDRLDLYDGLRVAFPFDPHWRPFDPHSQSIDRRWGSKGRQKRDFGSEGTGCGQ